MTRDKLIKIYQETKSICSDIPTPTSEKFKGNKPLNTFTEKEGNIIVEPLDTVSALIKYSKTGKTAVLNMASSKRKGGGVENGSVAQEECLFRCSNLFTIPDDFYPIESEQYIYTKDASFVRNGFYTIMDPIKADVVTMPAINLNMGHIDNPKKVDNYEVEMTFKIYYMLNAALINGCDNIIVGAWGCGVFKNDPKVVSKLFNQVLNGFFNIRPQFKNIVFAIINDGNSVGNNFEVFKNEFGG